MANDATNKQIAAWASLKRDCNRSKPFQGWVYDPSLKRQVHVGHDETQSGAVGLARAFSAVRQASNGLPLKHAIDLSRAVHRDRFSGQASLPLGDKFDEIARKAQM